MKVKIERSIRQALSPHRFGSWGDNFKCSSANGSKPSFNIDGMLMVNIIHDLMISGYWKYENEGDIPKSWKKEIVWKNREPIYHKNTCNDAYDSFLKNSNDKRTKEYSYSELSTKMYPFLRDRISSASSFKKTIINLSNLRFNLNLRIRSVYHSKKTLYNNKTFKNFTIEFPEIETFYLNTKNNPPSSLMDFVIVDETDFSRGGISDLKFYIKLHNPLMAVMRQGAMYINFDWIPEEIYTTKMNSYSKFLYILMLAGKINKEYEYTIYEIVDRLQLNPNQSINQLCGLVEGYLGSLEKNQFITVNKINGKFKNRRYFITNRK